eukprot:CAMPEP_0171351162 /NCGR_PEP_ID=MMETSP0878-20121228/38293_1 /TAXON_ID=67004 /ORGANISM="Thalassiosira weissflogii, Strain CCMP1336" /LENGTH=267 /DNA_ID=CAMNT_0011856335 /DNA_START=37 /DNA_END=837 /DNA_ORIENTATION=-
MTDFRIFELMNRIEAMRSQEESISLSHNYFLKSHLVDAGSRSAIATWCDQVADTLSFSRETVGIAMLYFDRYLSSGKGQSGDSLQSKDQFQLAAIASFYLAIKLNEPIVMGIDHMSRMTRGFYSEEEIATMEQDILFSLEWRVSSPTPMDFVRHLLELLPESVHPSCAEGMLQSAKMKMEFAKSFIFFSSHKPSIVGVGCIMCVMSETKNLTQTELTEFCIRMSTAMHYEQLPLGVLDVQQRFLMQSKPLESIEEKPCNTIDDGSFS